MSESNPIIGRVLSSATDSRAPAPALSQLAQDVMQADAAMLLRYLEERATFGNLSPITTREALEAIHRKQPATGVLPIEAAHVSRVMSVLRGMISE